MPTASSSTAVLLFTRTPEEEVRYKTFVYNANQRTNKAVARRLIRHTRQTITRSGLPVFVISSTQQRGATFGERLTAAFGEIFNQGFERVISIGNDTLSLSPSDLLHASSLLDTHAAVLGPTPNGGTYLIGLHRSAFSPDVFSRLPWETRFLFDRLASSFAEASGKVAILSYQHDVNTPEDLSTQYKVLLKHSVLYRFIKDLLDGTSSVAVRAECFFIPRQQTTYISLRAPPQATTLLPL